LTDNLDILENYTYYNLSQYNYSIINDSLIVYLDEGINNATEILFDISEFEDEDIASFSIKAALLAIESAETSINSFSNSAEEYYNYTYQQKTEFDNAVLLLYTVKDMLDMDIAATEEYIVKIDVAVEKVELIREELTSSLVQLSKLEPGLAEKLIKPILKNFEPVLPDVENIKLAFPGMLAIIIIFISILFSNIVTLAEINSKAFYRNLIAPVNSIIFIIGLIITNILVVFFQIVVLLLVGQFKFNIDIFSVFLPLSVIIILLSLFFICLGMITSVLLRNVQTSILTTTFFALGFFLFSDAVAPLETMPPLASLIAAKNPFVIASLAFKKIIIFNLGVSSVLSEIILLGSYLAFSLVLLIFFSIINLRDSK
jgi:ABC-type multidrug transport system permease subunit